MKKIQHELQDLTELSKLPPLSTLSSGHADVATGAGGSFLASLNAVAATKSAAQLTAQRGSRGAQTKNSLAVTALAQMSLLRSATGSSGTSGVSSNSGITSRADLNSSMDSSASVSTPRSISGAGATEQFTRTISLQSTSSGTSTEGSRAPPQQEDVVSVTSTATSNPKQEHDRDHDSEDHDLCSSTGCDTDHMLHEHDAEHHNQSHELVIKFGTPRPDIAAPFASNVLINKASTDQNDYLSAAALEAIDAAASLTGADPTIISSQDVAVNQSSTELYQSATRCVQNLKVGIFFCMDFLFHLLGLTYIF